MSKVVRIIIICCLSLGLGAECGYAQSTYFKKTEELMLKGSYQQAAQEAQRVLAHHHKSAIKAKAYYLLGICLLKQAQYAQARKKFNVVVSKYRRTKFYDDASLGIADSYYLAGQLKQAQQSYSQFLKNFPRSELASLAEQHLASCREGKRFSSSYFAVQVGCFVHKNNALRLRDELKDQGYQAYVLKMRKDNLYHVRVGKLSNKQRAESLERELKSLSYPTKLCP